MKKILKHSFEAVSLLTTNNGMLDVTIVPASNQPDWLIPSSLILSVDDYDKRTSLYEWQQQDVVVFHLLPESETPDKMIVLEGNTSIIAWHYKRQASFSDYKPVLLKSKILSCLNHSMTQRLHITQKRLSFDENVVLSYLFKPL